MCEMRNALYILSILLSSFPAFGQKYRTPDPDMIDINISSLPIDVNQINFLSEFLAQAANRKIDNTKRRELDNCARLIGLSLAINSNNKFAKELNEKFIKQSSRKHSHLEKNIEFLGNENQSPNTQKLSNLIKDSLKFHPDYKETLSSHELDISRWENVLPLREEKIEQPIIAATKPLKAKVNKQKDLKKTKAPIAKPKKTERSLKTNNFKFNQNNYEFKTVVHLEENISEFQRRSYTDLTKVKISFENQKGFKFNIKPFFEDNERKELIQTNIGDKLKSIFGTEIKGRIDIQLENNFSNTNQGFIAPGVIASTAASLQNKPLINDLIIIGVFGKEDTFKLPKNMWKSVKLIMKSEDRHTIIAPLESAVFFKQILAYGHLDFFIKNEIILTNSIKESAFLSMDDLTENQRKAKLQFAEIKEICKGREVWNKTTDPKVKKSLKEILALNPNHLSAKMLLYFRSEKYTKGLDNRFFIQDIKKAMNNITWVNNLKKEDKLYSQRFEKSHDEMSESLKELEPIASQAQQKIIKNVEDTIDYYKSIARHVKNNEWQPADNRTQRQITTIKERLVNISKQLKKLEN